MGQGGEGLGRQDRLTNTSLDEVGKADRVAGSEINELLGDRPQAMAPGSPAA